jgi:O-methyltransferase
MDLADRYLDLLAKALTRFDGLPDYVEATTANPVKKIATAAIRLCLPHNVSLLRQIPFDAETRRLGRDWPLHADTMIGLKRLENLKHAVRDVVSINVPGDLIETGVWRGGGSIFMRAALEAYGDATRMVWCADSFEGLPPPEMDRYSQDVGMIWHTQKELAVSLEEVKANFSKYGYLDSRVVFLKGWFKDTLPTAPIEKISILRLDGDLYASTMDALNALYAKVSPGGYVIVDDYGIPEDTCRRAVTDFRSNHGIVETIEDIDGFGAYWRRR